MVALEQAVAAPLATRNLADLGARVIKLERVDGGDFARSYDHAVHGLSSHFVWLNRGKESVALNLKDPQGLQVAKQVLAHADVFIHNCAPGAVERLGLGAENLLEEHPRLVVAGISGYGAGGPLRDRKAYDMLIQAESGLVSVTGTPETPTKTGVPSSDIAAGMYTAQAVVAALFRRERTGRGAVIDISMFDATAEWLGHPMYMQLHTGSQIPRMGLSHASIAPYDAYPTADGQILIGVQNDRGWQALVTEVFGRPELADHPRLSTNPLRVANRAECDAVVAEETSAFTTGELDTRLAEAGVPAAQVNEIAGLVNHPQLAARDRWRDVETPGGVVKGLLPPITFADVELPMAAVPALGASTACVLAELGFDDDAIRSLDAAGIIHRPTSAPERPVALNERHTNGTR